MVRQCPQFSAAALLALIPLAAVAAGCGKEVTLRQVVLESAELRRSQAADHAPLVSELARLKAERAFPLDVVSPLPDPETNAAAVLDSLVDPLLRNGILQRTSGLFPDGVFQFTPLELAETRQFLEKHQHRLDRVYEALRRPQCVFPVEFQLGFFYEPAFVDNVAIACRLLAFEAADVLEAGELIAALRPVESMWRLIGCLSKEKLLTARLRAAELRAEALLVMEAIANHPDAQAADLEVLLGILLRQLADWPADAGCLVGDRAMTLHAYECIRAGLLKWVLTSEEKQRFRDEFNFDALPEVVAQTIDHDQAYYLAAMRRHIELCELPYYKRRPELVRLTEDLDARRRSSRRSEYPHLAATLFLPGLDEAHAALARDRARCEAFAIALSVAVGREPPPYETNAHHGGPYEVIRESERIVVRLNEPDERDVVIARPY